MLANDNRQATAIVEGLPPERRALYRVCNVDEAAELLRRYIDAGFGGFTFNNCGLPTVESVGLAGELIKSLGGAVGT